MLRKRRSAAAMLFNTGRLAFHSLFLQLQSSQQALDVVTESDAVLHPRFIV